MATYATQSTITPEQLATADDPDELIRATEETVRVTLEGTSDDAGGETVIGWLARIPGTGPGLAPGTQHPSRFDPWDPAHDEVPDEADLLTCRGRRTT